MEKISDLDVLCENIKTLRVKNNLSEQEVEEFLKINKNYFENKGYDVYFTGAKYKYKNVKMKVEPNELMIAIKNT